MVSFGGDTTPTAVNIRTSLGMASSATSATDELTKDATSSKIDRNSPFYPIALDFSLLIANRGCFFRKLGVHRRRRRIGHDS